MQRDGIFRHVGHTTGSDSFVSQSCACACRLRVTGSAGMSATRPVQTVLCLSRVPVPVDYELRDLPACRLHDRFRQFCVSVVCLCLSITSYGICRHVGYTTGSDSFVSQSCACACRLRVTGSAGMSANKTGSDSFVSQSCACVCRLQVSACSQLIQIFVSVVCLCLSITSICM